MSLGRRKTKKEISPLKAAALQHHKSKPSRSDRAEFPRSVIDQLIVETDNRCAECGGNATTTHHVMPRGRGGRGVKANALRLCGSCHDLIQTNEERLQHWIDVFTERFGPYFWFDSQDWEEYSRKRAATEAKLAAERLQAERIREIAELVARAARRALHPREVRIIRARTDEELAVLTGMLRDCLAGPVEPDKPFD